MLQTGPVETVRRWRYAAPPWRVYEALAREHDHWLTPSPGAATPKITEATPEERVVFAPWLDNQVERVEVGIHREPDRYGAAVTVVAHSTHPLSDDARHRLGTIFGAALRAWVDGG